jgi:hypothetical protein
MQNFNKINSVLSEKECFEMRDIFLKNTATLSNLGDKCYGIDINNTASFLWFKKKLLDKINNFFDLDLKLIFAFYASFTKPFDIHTDIKPLPNDAKGTPYVSCLIPLSVDNSKDKCNLANTIIFKRQENVNAEADHKKYLSHCNLEQLKNRQIDKIFNWTPYDMIWWRSELDHCSSHFKNFQSKECIVVHTYVQ